MSAPRKLSIGEIYELRHENYDLHQPGTLVGAGYSQQSRETGTMSEDFVEPSSLLVAKKPRKGKENASSENLSAMRVRLSRATKRPRWKRLTPKHSSEILPVAGHCMVSCSNRIYVFGGYFPSVSEGNCNVWSPIHPETSDSLLLPQPRRHASMVFHGQSLYVFGGFTEKDEVLCDLWMFDLVKKRWLPIFSRPGSFWPAARAEHSAVVYKDKMLIFGGYDGKRKLHDTVAFDLKDYSWEAVAITGGYYPNRRCKHSAVVFKNKMYVLGGFQFANDKNAAVTDLVALDLENMSWNLEFMNGPVPEGLQAHKAVVVNDAMYVFGGKVREQTRGNSSQSSLNDKVLCYRFDINCWSLIECEGSSPEARQLHGACVVNNHQWKHSLIIHGGVDRSKELYYDDIWELEGIEGSPLLRQCDSCEALCNLVNSEKFADVDLLVDGRRIPAHRCILYSKSDYFRRLLESDMKESFQTSIEIKGIGYSTFLEILFYIYTGRPALDMKYEELIDLLVASDMLGLEDLKCFCMKELEEAVNVENVSSVCQLAAKYSAEQLKTFCVNFILKYFSQVVETKGFEELLRNEFSGLAKEILRLHAKVTCWNSSQ